MTTEKRIPKKVIQTTAFQEGDVRFLGDYVEVLLRIFWEGTLETETRVWFGDGLSSNRGSLSKGYIAALRLVNPELEVEFVNTTES